MNFFKKLTTISLALATVVGCAITTHGAVVDKALTGAKSDISLIAADFEVSGTKLNPESELPSAYSSKDLGYTLPIRNQIYNTCWAYGSSSTLESVMLKDGYDVEHFAPMHMNHWGTKREDGSGWNRSFTSGGYAYISLGYFTSWQGPRLEKDYVETTLISDFEWYNETAKKQVAVNGVVYLEDGDDETIKTAVYENGAVVANYHVDERNYNPDTHAYYCNTIGLQTYQLNGHCISIVGWDDNFPKEYFEETAQPSSDGAWLCKNSWGKNWGDHGYYWISYEDEYLFSDKFGPSYTFTDYEPYDNSKMIYQNEVDGATYEFDCNSSFDTITYINVFDTDKDYTIIDKINFESTAQGSPYIIYRVPMAPTGLPTARESKWIEIGSGTVPYKGYLSIDTEDFLVNEEKFAIGVKLTKTESSTNSIGVCEWLSTSGGGYIFLPQSKHGQSYIAYGGSYIMDVMDLYKDSLEDDIGGTFVIKAIGEKELYQGDIDMDGKVTILDATGIQRYLAFYDEFSDKQESLADTDKDGLISIMDATTIQMQLAGIDSDFNDPFDDNFEVLE